MTTLITMRESKRPVTAIPLGMAHFPGTGPQGETCRTCRWWQGNTVEQALKDSQGEVSDRVLVPSTLYQRWRNGRPLKQSCVKYRQIKRSQKDPDPRSRRIEHDTLACSHWLRARDPQPLVNPNEGKKTTLAEALGV